MIELFKVHLPKKMDSLFETLESGYVAEGPRVAEFEKKITPTVCNEKVIALNSGTSALHLALVLANVGIGDVVITTPLTSPATNISIVNLGAKIIWADVDPKSANISPDSIKQLILKYGENVKAVITVDWGGFPSDIDAIRKAIPTSIRIIQDSAHSIGATYKGKLVGSLDADFTTFSFQAIKHMTTGDGGLLACKSSEDLERGRKLKWFGIDRCKLGRTWKDDLEEIGYKFHMNDIAASIGIHQLDEIESTVERRRAIAKRYDNELQHIKKQETNKYICNSSYWLYTLFVDDINIFMEYMKNNGVVSFPVHIRNDYYSGFKQHVFGSDELVNVENISSRMCCIPVGQWLTDENVDSIISAVNNFNHD
jgi:perosamine synthetase